jgi:hypothetical protein
MSLLYVQCVHQTGSVIGELFDREWPLPRFGIAHASIIENDQFVT